MWCPILLPFRPKDRIVDPNGIKVEFVGMVVLSNDVEHIIGVDVDVDRGAGFATFAIINDRNRDSLQLLYIDLRLCETTTLEIPSDRVPDSL